jgi:hypothetical protein
MGRAASRRGSQPVRREGPTRPEWNPEILRSEAKRPHAECSGGPEHSASNTPGKHLLQERVVRDQERRLKNREVARPWVSHARVGIWPISTVPCRTSRMTSSSPSAVWTEGMRNVTSRAPFDRRRTLFAKATPAGEGPPTSATAIVSTVGDADGAPLALGATAASSATRTAAATGGAEVFLTLSRR